MIPGFAQIGRGHRVVDDQWNTGLFRNRGNRCDVDDDAARVGDAFDHDGFGLRCQRLLEACRIGRIGEDHVPAEFLERMVELIDRAAIELPASDEIVAGLEQRVECDELRGMAGRDGQGRRATFERGNAAFQHTLRRVADARINVAENFEIEQRRSMVGIVENKSRGLINRRDAGARGRVGRCAGVHGKGRETWRRILFSHGLLLQLPVGGRHSVADEDG